MTSLIERLRSWSMADCQEAATALEQARELLCESRAVHDAQTNTGFVTQIDEWLRLIDGEQEKEG